MSYNRVDIYLFLIVVNFLLSLNSEIRYRFIVVYRLFGHWLWVEGIERLQISECA